MLNLQTTQHGKTVVMVVVLFVVMLSNSLVKVTAIERRYSFIKRSLQHPLQHRGQVIMLYSKGQDDGTVQEATMALQESDWEFVKCDVTKKSNRKLALQDGVTDTPVLFVRAVGEAIERFDYPVQMLQTHLDAKDFPANPKDVIEFTSARNFQGLLHDSDPARPIFVRFVELGCASCVATERVFYQAATYFKDDCLFVNVVCDATVNEASFCSDNNANGSDMPVLVLFTKEGNFLYERQQYSLVAFDEFFVAHQHHFPEHVQPPTDATLSSDAPPSPKVLNVDSSKSEAASNANACDSSVLQDRVAQLESTVAQQSEAIERLEKSIERLKKVFAAL